MFGGSRTRWGFCMPVLFSPQVLGEPSKVQVPAQSQAWIWQVGEGSKFTAILYFRESPFELCCFVMKAWKTFVVSFPLKSGTLKRPARLKGEDVPQSLNSWTYQRFNKLRFFRFRQFSVSKDDFKVLDEDTPGGGLVAEFCHMVWNWPTSCTVAGWRVLKSQPLIGRSARYQLQPLCLFQSLKESKAKVKGTTEVRRRICLHPVNIKPNLC